MAKKKATKARKAPKIQITAEQQHRIFALLQAAMDAQIECWDRQREIETLIGRDLDGLGELINNMSVGDIADIDGFYETFEKELIRPAAVEVPQ